MRAGAAPYWLLFLLLLLPYAYFNHSDGWNQGSRFAELHAVVLKHSLRIDDYQGMTGDKALADGHYYPFLGFAAAHGIRRFPKTGAMLAVVSIALMAMVTAVMIDPAQDVMAPLKDIYLVRLEQGRFAANPGRTPDSRPSQPGTARGGHDGHRVEHHEGLLWPASPQPGQMVGFAREPAF